MKMRVNGSLAFVLLAVSVLSYGIAGPAYGQESDSELLPPQRLPVDAMTDKEKYSFGETVTVTGSLKNYTTNDPFAGDVTYTVVSPINNILDVGQVSPDSRGEFTFSFLIGGPNFEDAGDYTINIHFISNIRTLTFENEGQERTPPPPEEIDMPEDVITEQPDDVNAPVLTVPADVTVDATGDFTVVDIGMATAVDDIDADVMITNNAPDEFTIGITTITWAATDSSGNTAEGTQIVTVQTPPPPECGEGTILVDGMCQIKPPEPVQPVPDTPECGEGTVLEDGVCVVEEVDDNGGCLVATAAYGTEMAPQIQMLREIRDDTVMSTASGSAFMGAFNTVYYSFAPTVADWERESPVFRDAVRVFITPMITTLSIMTLAEGGSDAEVLGLGISVIALNLGMYIAAPALVGLAAHRRVRSRV